MKTAVAAPAPRPSDEEMLEAIGQLTLGDLARVTRTLYGSIFIRSRFPTNVFCAGVAGSGTRLLYDLVSATGLPAVHASQPGYLDRPGHHDPETVAAGLHFDVANPIWWTPEQLTAEHGLGRFVVINRDYNHAAQSAIRRGFVQSSYGYALYRERALAVLNELDAYRLSYENLVADPQGEYNKLTDWLGVPRRTVGPVLDRNKS